MPTISFTISAASLTKWKAVYADEYAVYVTAMEEADQTPMSETNYLKAQGVNLLKKDYRNRRRKQILEAADSPDDLDLE